MAQGPRTPSSQCQGFGAGGSVLGIQCWGVSAAWGHPYSSCSEFDFSAENVGGERKKSA